MVNDSDDACAMHVMVGELRSNGVSEREKRRVPSQNGC